MSTVYVSICRAGSKDQYNNGVPIYKEIINDEIVNSGTSNTLSNITGPSDIIPNGCQYVWRIEAVNAAVKVAKGTNPNATTDKCIRLTAGSIVDIEIMSPNEKLAFVDI